MGSLIIAAAVLIGMMSLTLFLLIRFVRREKGAGQWILCAVLAVLLVLTVATRGNFLRYIPPIYR